MSKFIHARETIDLLSGKWRIAILNTLRNGPLRTNALQRAMSQVSAKMLIQTLRGMERDGLVDRRIHSILPPRVEYKLTDMGTSLIKPLQDLSYWAKAHLAERDESRRQFDAATKGARANHARRGSTPKSTN